MMMRGALSSSFSGRRILIVGASGDLARPLISSLLQEGATLGLHYRRNRAPLAKFETDDRCLLLQQELKSEQDCKSLIDSFAEGTGGLDGLVQLCGGIHAPVHWEQLTEENVYADLSINLMMPFFLVQKAMPYLKKQGGSVVLTSNVGASHGGGSDSMMYGISKAGVERLVRGVAKDCAKDGIRVNAVAPGLIASRFHTERMKRTEEKIRERISLIPMKRSGTPEEVASAIRFLLSEEASYITGEVMKIAGGDWL